MRAMIYTEYGDPNVLHSADVDMPSAGPGQVRVKVHAAGVNPVDWKTVAGRLSDGNPLQAPTIPGLDVAGTVDAVGPGVTAVAIGDAVFGQSVNGSVAEYALVDEYAIKPTGVRWEVAGVLNVAGETAVRALDLLPLTSGDTLLVDGAAGGVGLVVAQIAIARGATVMGTASKRNHELLQSLRIIPLEYGADVARRAQALSPTGVRYAVDTAGKGSVPELVALTGDPTRVVSIADRSASDHGAHQTFTPANRVGSLNYVANLIEEGKLHVPIALTFPLEGATAAYQASKTGHVAGKIVLIP